MATLMFLLTLVMLLNGIVWLAISMIILYNLYEYTADKHEIKKDLHPFFKRYARFMT